VGKAPPYSVPQVEATRLPEGSAERDAVAVEEPLGIRVNGEPDAVTMHSVV
jgi:formate dehydrogenase assembly factor FdhD